MSVPRSLPTGRCAAGAIALSLGSLPFLLPHVLEDFERGIAQRAGLAPGAGAALLGAGLGVQFLALVLAGRGRRGGLIVVAVAGAVWTVGALWDHGPELLARGPRFRGSALSVAAAVQWVANFAVSASFPSLQKAGLGLAYGLYASTDSGSLASMMASLQHRHSTMMSGSSGSTCEITRPTASYAVTSVVVSG